MKFKAVASVCSLVSILHAVLPKAFSIFINARDRSHIALNLPLPQCMVNIRSWQNQTASLFQHYFNTSFSKGARLFFSHFLLTSQTFAGIRRHWQPHLLHRPSFDDPHHGKLSLPSGFIGGRAHVPGVTAPSEARPVR